MKRHINIPIFIPHLGCPNQCVFCNQRTISGVSEFSPEGVKREIEEALSTVPHDAECEIAFFGGSFTGIDRSLMLYLLDIGKQFIDEGMVQSMRCSTRPDYISEGVLDVLYEYGVRTIELGLQSIDDDVLDLTKRGHSSRDAECACRMIVDRGFTLGGQMMIGLPGSSAESERKTAEFIISSGAAEARIYPTVVFYDTELCDLARRGLYTPLSLDEAVERSAAVKRMLDLSGVKVIRVGLCSSDNLISDDTYFAGPNHAALGELVENKIYVDLIRERLSSLEANGCVATVTVSKGALSKAIGQKQINKKTIISEFSLKNALFREDLSLGAYEINVEIS